MSLNMKTLTQALAKAGAVIEKTVHTTVQEVTGPRPLQDYDLLDQAGSGGPGLVWRLFSARPRASAPSAPYPLVTVWLLDKRALSETRSRAGLSKAAEDAFLDLVVPTLPRIVRIRRPGVLHVVQTLDESKNAIAMVTEQIFASVASALGQLDNISRVPKELKGMVSQQDLVPHIRPLFVLAFDDSDPCTREGVLQRTVPLLRQLDMQLVNQAMVPHVHGLALKTTVASVRVNVCAAWEIWFQHLTNMQF